MDFSSGPDRGHGGPATDAEDACPAGTRPSSHTTTSGWVNQKVDSGTVTRSKYHGLKELRRVLRVSSLRQPIKPHVCSTVNIFKQPIIKI